MKTLTFFSLTFTLACVIIDTKKEPPLSRRQRRAFLKQYHLITRLFIPTRNQSLMPVLRKYWMTFLFPSNNKCTPELARLRTLGYVLFCVIGLFFYSCREKYRKIFVVKNYLLSLSRLAVKLACRRRMIGRAMKT